MRIEKPLSKEEKAEHALRSYTPQINNAFIDKQSLTINDTYKIV